MYDFLFVIIELFSLALTVETLQAEICRRERLLKGVGASLRSPILGGRKLEVLPFHVVYRR